MWHSRVEGRSYTELDEFKAFIGPCSQFFDFSEPRLLIFISILVYIHWDDWSQFENKFGPKLSSEHVRSLKDGIPVPKEYIRKQLFEEKSYARDFYDKQFIFLSIRIQADQEPLYYDANMRLPLLGEPVEARSGFFGKVFKVNIAAGQFVHSVTNGDTNQQVSLQSHSTM